MQSTKRKTNSNGNSSEQVPKQKERHIVSWSQEEDDILREQIRLHGTENWGIIASNFKDKTTRQCRRRWYTYLNSDFKKGGWSEEEDLLLCEAQKIYGNRWTEIAKVVSGRTDNAVKNRFSTLCKKRAKHAALAKENSTSPISLNNKRIVFSDRLNGISETEGPLKRMRRTHIANMSDGPGQEVKFVGECETTTQLLRAPFAVIGQNFPAAQQLSEDIKETPRGGTNGKIEGTFLKKDDPKILALLQQAELLTSLAAKVNSDNTDQSIENAWKIFQESCDQTKCNDDLSFRSSEMDSYLQNVKDLVEELTCRNEDSGPSWRQPDIYEESSASSEYSTGSSLSCKAPHGLAEHGNGELCEQLQNIVADVQLTHSSGQPDLAERGKEISCGGETTSQALIVGALDETKIDDIVTCGDTIATFDSPILETPLFRTMAAAIPSPKFTESEKHFLMRALGMESTITNPSSSVLSQPPACKRALLQSL